MDERAQHNRSHLFTVRVWTEEPGQTPVAWRGKVQHVMSGAWCYFHGWTELADFLQIQAEDRAPGSLPRE
jgi:hypothetical protein